MLIHLVIDILRFVVYFHHHHYVVYLISEIDCFCCWHLLHTTCVSFLEEKAKVFMIIQNWKRQQ